MGESDAFNQRHIQDLERSSPSDDDLDTNNRVYSRLTTKRKEIRLLELQSGTGDERQLSPSNLSNALQALGTFC